MQPQAKREPNYGQFSFKSNCSGVAGQVRAWDLGEGLGVRINTLCSRL